MFLSLTLNIFHIFFSVSIVDFEQVHVTWVKATNDNLPNDFKQCLSHRINKDFGITYEICSDDIFLVSLLFTFTHLR